MGLVTRLKRLEDRERQDTLARVFMCRVRADHIEADKREAYAGLGIEPGPDDRVFLNAYEARPGEPITGFRPSSMVA